MFIYKKSHIKHVSPHGFINDSGDKRIMQAIYTRVKTNHLAKKHEDK